MGIVNSGNLFATQPQSSPVHTCQDGFQGAFHRIDLRQTPQGGQTRTSGIYLQPQSDTVVRAVCHVSGSTEYDPTVTACYP